MLREPRTGLLAGGALTALVILLAAAIPRLFGLTAPPLDGHHVRQSDTASIARNMTREGVDLLHPRIDWAGPQAGYVESEMPLYAAAVAGLWRLASAGEDLPYALARGLSILCWLGGGIALLLLVRRRLPGPHWPYLLLYCFSPLGVVCSRSIQPDALATAMLLLACERADAASTRSGAHGWLMALMAGALGGAAVAAKGNLAIFLVLVPALILSRRPQNKGPSPFAAAASLALAVAGPTLWYWHAHQHLGISGFTFGIWGEGAHKWGQPDIWFSLWTWRSILGTLAIKAITPLGLLLVAWGMMQARGQAALRPFLLALLLAGVGAVAVAEGFALHDYYQLPLVPFASVLCGAALMDLARRFRDAGQTSRRARAVILGLAGVLLALSLIFGARFVRQSLQQDRRIQEVALGAQQALPARGALVVVDPFPQTVLYALDRRGWHRTGLDLQELPKLRRLGADHLLLSAGSGTFQGGAEPDALKTMARRLASGPGWRLYQLMGPRGDRR